MPAPVRARKLDGRSHLSLTCPDPVLHLRTFGGLSLSRDGAPLAGAAAQRRRLAVLAILGAAGERGMSRDRLLALLWPDRDPAAGRQALSQALYALRRDSGDTPLVHGAGTEDLRIDLSQVQVDLLDFDAAIARTEWATAAALYAGPFLDGIHLDGDAGEFERWVEAHRMRTLASAERAFEQLASAADARGDHAVAAEWWRRLTAIDPLRTRAAAGLIQALAHGGDRSGAIRYAEQYADQVRAELGSDPNPHILALADQLRRAASAAPLPADATDRIGGRYVIDREIGRGGMAVVSLARDLRHDRDVALKMLLPELGDAVDRERMLREIRVTARLQHPHILPLYDSGEHGGRLFYVMPFVAGETLRARLQREGSLPLAVALRFAIQVADALDHAHRQGIVHRDVKPENILLTSATGDGEAHAIVADFGIVHLMAAAGHERLTQPFLAIGTPTYMSPEQILADGAVDGRTDVYALGCVLYEMLAGRPPWIALEAQALLARILTTDPPPLRQVAPSVPAAVAELIEQALHREADARVASAGTLARALERISSGGTMVMETSGTTLILPPLPPPRPLVGRDRARETARTLLLREDVRLVTLTGAGGSGKTSLAERVAHDAIDAFDGVTLIDLSTVTDPAQVLPTIASAIGVREREQRGILEALTTALRPRRLLLVLDNMEQVVDAAPDLARLLAAAPALRLLVTSRVRLRLRGEYEFHVAPLTVPLVGVALEVSTLPDIPSVALFLLRAKEAGRTGTFDDEGLRAIAELCIRLDGLPLALELAAARTRLLTPSAILTRLDARGLDFLVDGAQDLPARQRTLRTTIGWSADLLTPDARRALAHLGAFAGPFDLPTAVAILEADEDAVLEWLQELLDANLVRRLDEVVGEPRLALLETIRAFAREDARALGVAERATDRHVRHFLTIAQRESTRLGGAAQAEALAYLDGHRAEFQRALEVRSAMTTPEGRAEFTALVLALWRGWLVAGHWSDGRGWLTRAIEATADPVERATILGAAGTMAQNQGDYEEARQLVEQSLALWRVAGDTRGQARALAALGWLAWRRNQLAESRQLSDDALALFTDAGDEAGIALAANNLGWVSIFDGSRDDGARHFDEALRRRRALGDRRNTAFTLTGLAWAALYAGDHTAAMPALDEADRLYREIGERQLAAFADRIRAEALLVRGDSANALTLLEGSCVPMFERIGDRWGLYGTLALIGDAHRLTGDLEAATRAYEGADTIITALDDDYGRASLLARRARLHRRAGDRGRADDLIAEATALAAASGFVLPPLADMPA